jgi:hypothetical protein
MMYVRTSDLDAGTCKGGVTNFGCPVKLKASAPVEPLVLRVAAGECLQVTVRNRLPVSPPDLGNFMEFLRMVRRNPNDPNANGGMTSFNNNLVRPTGYASIHTALLAYDVNDSDGAVVGNNPGNVIGAPGTTRTYQWYAGDLTWDATGNLVATPVEFGPAIINSADKIKSPSKGLVGAVIVEPQGSRWNDAGEVATDHQVWPKTRTRTTRASATVVRAGTSSYRDFAAVITKGASFRYKDATAVESLGAEGATLSEDAEDAGQISMNYGSEPMWFRFGLKPNSVFNNAPGGLGAVTNAGDAYSNFLGVNGSGTAFFDDPSTPVFEANRGDEFRIGVLYPGGTQRGSVMTLHGHVWQRAPYGCGPGATAKDVGLCPNGVAVGSTSVGQSLASFYMGAQDQVVPGSHFHLVLPSAGGTGAVPGDYLLRDVGSFGNSGGLWGILRAK